MCATLCTLISACDSAVAQIGIFQPIALFSFYGNIHKKALLSLEFHQGKEQKKIESYAKSNIYYNKNKGRKFWLAKYYACFAFDEKNI